MKNHCRHVFAHIYYIFHWVYVSLSSQQRGLFKVSVMVGVSGEVREVDCHGILHDQVFYFTQQVMAAIMTRADQK